MAAQKFDSASAGEFLKNTQGIDSASTDTLATLAKMAITFPVTGCVRLVKVEPVWLPAVAKLATKAAQLVAVTVPPMLTVLRAVCPQPLSPLPVLQTALILLALALAKPL